MEVATFMRAALRRWWIALLVALVAAGATYLVTRNTADSYNGSVTLTVPAAQAATTGSNGQWVENFSTALTTSDVVKEISKDTGASASDLTDGLAASQINNSSYIDVTYNSVDATRAGAVVVSAAKRTAAYLSRSDVQHAQAVKTSTTAALTAATTALTNAQKALTDFKAKNGSVDPNILVQSAQSSANQLVVSRLQAQAQSKPVAAYNAAIAAQRASITKYAPLAEQFNSISDRVHTAQVNNETAQSRASSANSAFVSALQPPLIGGSSADLVKGQTTMLKAVAIAGGIGLVLGIALALLVTALRRNKPSRRSRRRAAAHQATSATADDGAAVVSKTPESESKDSETLDRESPDKPRRSPSPTSAEHDDEFERV